MKKFILPFLIFLFLVAPVKAEEISDPMESLNRGIFTFNDTLDTYLLKPLAQGYDFITPDPVQDSVYNLFENLGYPTYLLSDIVQLKFDQAVEHTGRFLINSTLGVAGLFDVAKYFGLEEHREDFGVALAYHDVPAGPYIVLPLLGPSNLRDLAGRGVDLLTNPFFWFSRREMHDQTQNEILYGSQGLELLQTRTNLLEAIDSAKESSVDFYSFARSSYYQSREGLLEDKSEDTAASDLLDDDDEFYDDFE